jgi:uncharacterized protein
LVLLSDAAADQQLALPTDALSADPKVSGPAMARLAAAALAVYRAGNRKEFLDTEFRLEDLAGRPKDAVSSLREFHALDGPAATTRIRAYDVEYAIYEQARTRAATTGEAFGAAYATAFRDTMRAMDDKDAASALIRSEGADVSGWQSALDAIGGGLKDKSAISIDEAVRLLRAYYELRVAEATDAPSRRLGVDEDRRRWIIQRDVKVRTPGGATICALIVRPRSAPPRAPAALEFTIYADPDQELADARRAAGYGYVGIVGLSRGKGCSPDKPDPYRYDGDDADALIRWAAAQPWSDGQVGMFGGSYNGFTGWAALKHPPEALKAVDVGAPVSPGIDVPMEGNVVWMFVYPWTFYTTDNKTLDNKTYFDRPRWNRLQSTWYKSGKSYRSLDRIDGTPNPIWDQWLRHPAHDAYWQGTIPSPAQFAAIRVPVLQTAGYYFGGPGGSVWYWEQQTRRDPQARSYVLIGPYDHLDAQTGHLGSLVGESDDVSGLTLDPTALIDLIDLRYAWFDHFMKGKPMPAILQDRINYEVVGANVWKHAASFDAMGSERRRFYLAGGKLSATEPGQIGSSLLKVNLADRSDADKRTNGGGVRNHEVNTANGIVFESDPLTAPTEASGLFSGHLQFVTNKKDFDAEIDLYERTSDGDYVLLSQWWTRASYARDLSKRHLLTAGVPQTIDFRAIRLMSRQMEKGSRIVAVVHVIKESGRQINYGAGKDVNDETIDDAGKPLTIRLSNRSWIEIPFAS